MRWSVALVLALASVGFVAPGARAAETEEFPEYRLPTAPKRKFAASRATIAFGERLPEGEPSVFSTPMIADANLSERFDPEDPPVRISKEDLTRILERRLGRSLGGSEGALVFDVTFVEAKGRFARDPVTTVTLDVRVHRRGGSSLVATRGVSRLSGHTGGMSAGKDELLLAAVLDAFERAVLRDEFIVATNEALLSPPSGDAAPATSRERVVSGTRTAWSVQGHSASASGHVAALTFDAGKAYAFGLRYLHDHYSSSSGLAWGGYGAEIRALTSGDSTGAAGLLVLRGGIGVEQAFSIEAAGGVAGGEQAQGLVLLGVFWSFYYVDLGVSFQIPFAPAETPEWMSQVNFGLRINVPFQKTETKVERHSPLPAHDMNVLPGFSRGDADVEVD